MAFIIHILWRLGLLTGGKVMPNIVDVVVKSGKKWEK